MAFLKIKEESTETVQTAKKDHPFTLSEKCVEKLQGLNTLGEEISRKYEGAYMTLKTLGYEGSNLWHLYAHDHGDNVDCIRGYLMDNGIVPQIRELPRWETKKDYDIPTLIKHSLEIESELACAVKEFVEQAAKCEDPLTHAFGVKLLRWSREMWGKVKCWEDELTLFGEDASAIRVLDKKMTKVWLKNKQD